MIVKFNKSIFNKYHFYNTKIQRIYSISIRFFGDKRRPPIGHARRLLDLSSKPKPPLLPPHTHSPNVTNPQPNPHTLIHTTAAVNTQQPTSTSLLPTRVLPLPITITEKHKEALDSVKKTVMQNELDVRLKEKALSEQPFPFLCEQDIIKKALANNLIKYSTAGKEGDNGGLQLTKAGHELNRTVTKDLHNLQQKAELFLNDNKAQFGYDDDEIPVITTVNETQAYSVVTLEIHEDTLIPTPIQNHMVVVKNNSKEDQTVEGFAYLTSTSGIKTGISGLTGPINPKLADVKASGQQQEQYVAPIIPHIIIPTSECEFLYNLDSYINKVELIAVLDDVYYQTSKYQVIAYKTQGISLEKLHEINELYAEINKKDNKQDSENIYELNNEFSD